MGLAPTFRDKKVLITGHAGFKGGWLALWLHSMGAKVYGYGLNPPTDPSFYKAVGVYDFITPTGSGDVKDLDSIATVVWGYKPDFIFHLAAQPIVRVSYEQPIETFRSNVDGTINVLEAIRVSDHPIIGVFITSDKCYENREWQYAYRENDALGGHDPYSASKAMAELAIQAYRKSYFSDKTSKHLISSARAGNIIGGGDWLQDRIIPDCVRAIQQDKPMVIRNIRAIRPWQHVLDALGGYLFLASVMSIFSKSKERHEYTGAWNFGPNPENCQSVIHLVHFFREAWKGCGMKIEELDIPTTNKHEAKYLRLDSTKARTVLGWKPKYDLFQTLDKTAAWYKSYYSGDVDMKQFSLEQIEEWQNI
jgi:CDP-glucose 4,6-dehydratase